MRKKIKIAILGCSNVAWRKTIPAIMRNENFLLVAVASRDKVRANLFANAFNCKPLSGYESVLNMSEVDSVYIALPGVLHKKWVLDSLEAGKHVLVEKPMVLNLESAKEIIDKAAYKKLVVMENFAFLFHAQNHAVKSCLSNNCLGRIRCFRSSFGFPPMNKNNYRYNKELGGGALYDAGVYTLRVSQFFFGGDIKIRSSSAVMDNKYKIDISGGVFFNTSEGVIGELAYGFDHFYQCNYEIWGSRGKLRVNKAFTPGKDEVVSVALEKRDKEFKLYSEADDQLLNILSAFSDLIRNKNYEKVNDEILFHNVLLQDVNNNLNLSYE